MTGWKYTSASLAKNGSAMPGIWEESFMSKTSMQVRLPSTAVK